MRSFVILVLALFVASCSCQCYTENFNSYYSNCGIYDNQTISFLNGTVVIESNPTFEIFLVSNYSQYCYFGLGACSSQNIVGGSSGLGCNSPYCSLSFSVAPSLYYSFSLGNTFSTTYYTPQIVNITVRTEDGNFHYFNTSRPNNPNCYNSYPLYSYNFTSSIIGVMISGNFFYINSFTFCKNVAPPNTCQSSPQLYMFGGGSSCTSFSQNQCIQCSTTFGQQYYYTATCSPLGSSSDCHCTSYLHSGYNCTGSQLAQPMVNETCSSLTSFYPQYGSVCMPIYSLAPSISIVLYNATYPESPYCASVNENSCVRCTEYGYTYFYKPTCSAPGQCHVTQSYYSDCSSPMATIPIPNADCNELLSLYKSAGQVCAFGFYTTGQQFNKTLTVAAPSTTE